MKTYRARKIIILPVQIMTAVAVGIIIAAIVTVVSGQMATKSNPALDALVGTEVEISGTIAEDVEQSETTSHFKLSNITIKMDGGEKEISGEIYVLVNSNEELWRGDHLTLNGKLSTGFGTYAAAMWRPKIEKWERADPGDILIRIRNEFAKIVKKYIPEEESQLGLSYLLGMRNELSDEMEDILKIVGLTHLVVASGTHLSILVGATKKIFGKVSRFFGAFVGIIFIIIFASMIGWTASITRAAIVSSLTIIAQYSGRKFQPGRIILLAMAITLVIDPMNITKLGWLLSFGAYTGILIIAPKLTRMLYGKKNPPKLAQILLASVAATLLCLPLQLYFFGTFSLLALPANLLILPTMPVVMGLVFATGLAGILVPPVAVPVGFVTGKILFLHRALLGVMAEQTMFVWEIDPYQNWVFALYILPLLPWVWAGGKALVRYGARVLQIQHDRQYE